MARLYTHKRGKSGSTRPLSKKAPSWCKYSAEEVEALCLKFAREGNTPSMIGTILRDRHGIPLVKAITGKTIFKILKKSDAAPKMPEDLETLLRKSDHVRLHLQKNKSDHISKRSLALIESKIHRLVGFYRSEGVLPPDWKYKTVAASIV
ncbi:MAG: 30S ribosomal protein S15 [archaeon]